MCIRDSAYLDDFEKDLNGNYRYRGAHYRYAGEIPRGKALARLWACLLYTSRCV